MCTCTWLPSQGLLTLRSVNKDALPANLLFSYGTARLPGILLLLLSNCFGNFWARIEAEVISTFQLKKLSRTSHQCHLWMKQGIKSSKKRALILTTTFLFRGRAKSSQNSRILANRWEVNTGCFFLQMRVQGALGAAVPVATLLSVIGPLGATGYSERWR